MTVVEEGKEKREKDGQIEVGEEGKEEPQHRYNSKDGLI